jgi:hypothetical protein
MDKKKEEFLQDKYSVIYDSRYDAWRRLVGGSQVKFDLGVITEYIAGDNVLEEGHNFVDYNDADIDEKICICGCNRCGSLHKLYHRYSENIFLVGSSCITKAKGQEDYEKNKKCAKTNGLCRECAVPLVFKGLRVNAKKGDDKYCKVCHTKAHKKRKIYLNISYAEKNKYKALGTRWDAEIKKWYWVGCFVDMPEELYDKVANKINI